MKILMLIHSVCMNLQLSLKLLLPVACSSNFDPINVQFSPLIRYSSADSVLVVSCQFVHSITFAFDHEKRH